MRMLTIDHDILKSEVPTTDIRLHEENTMGNTEAEEMAYWNVYAAELFCAGDKVAEHIKKQIMAFTHLLAANMLLTEGHKDTARSHLRRSWPYFPSNIQPLLFNALKKLLF